uniref:C2H2-type domain-containing protein n=1 Tax=Caenorhabditis brenneri TaxID=135651 RepID=B6VBM8_CAEBE|nr:hypothetical protein Cbre_JD14.009 [Caenorhabditis brenneri]
MVQHKCKECGSTFKKSRYLLKHEIRMHKTPKKPREPSGQPLKCSMCDKVFTRVSHLQRHQMIHLNVRNYACCFCDEKFVQKAHLTRHVTRKHADDAGIEVKWIACNKCGHLFKTPYEVKVHKRTVHELHRCKKCKKVIEAGNDGLRQHHIRCRNKEKVCEHCQASFDRPADLAVHQISCLKKVAFMCTPCSSFFKQRVELDRHIKKFHFRSIKCSKCEYTSEAPLQNSRHVLECQKLVICGYCNEKNPDKDHIEQFHWKKLKRAFPRRVAEKVKKKEKAVEKDIPSTSDAVETEEITEEDGDFNGFLDDSEVRDDGSFYGFQEDRESENEHEDRLHDEDSLFEFPETSNSQLDFSSTAFDEEDDTPEDYLTFSICPKDADLSFHLRGKLPEQLVALFPELESTSIILLNTEISSPCRMTVRVPVFIPESCEKEAEMRKWLETKIILKDEK